MSSVVKTELITRGDMTKALDTNRGFIVTNNPELFMESRSKIHHPSCNIVKIAFEKIWNVHPDWGLAGLSGQTYYHFDSVEEVDIDHAELCTICCPK